jgi:hypothetical protein
MRHITYLRSKKGLISARVASDSNCTKEEAALERLSRSSGKISQCTAAKLGKSLGGANFGLARRAQRQLSTVCSHFM